MPAQQGTLSRGGCSCVSSDTRYHRTCWKFRVQIPQTSEPLVPLPQCPQSSFWTFPGKRLETRISPFSSPWGTAREPSSLHVTPGPVSQRRGARPSRTAHGVQQGEGCPGAAALPKKRRRTFWRWVGFGTKSGPARSGSRASCACSGSRRRLLLLLSVQHGEGL